MKHSIFALAIGFTISLPPQDAAAQSVGIQFAKMPVGTQMTYKQNNGDFWTDTYKGLKLGKYVIHRKSTIGGVRRPLGRLYFDKEGRLVKYASSSEGNLWSNSFLPYHCEYQVGNCSYSKKFRGERYEENGSSDTYVYNVTKNGSNLKISWKKNTVKDSGGTWTVTLGQYNLRTLEKWGSGTVKLVSVK